MKRYVIDVREPVEFAADHVDAGLNIPLTDLLNNSSALGSIPKNSELILYCNSGRRSGIAQTLLKSRGYTNVINGINKTSVLANLHSDLG